VLLAADENFNNDIVRALLRRQPNLDIIRIQAGLPMPGVFEVGRSVPVRTAIEDILLLVECSLEGEWEGYILYLPLR
jgi:hypothetical protein